MKKNTSIIVGISSATLLAMGNAIPAGADSSAFAPDTGTKRAFGSFVSKGDKFYVTDKYSGDGRGAYIDWFIPSTGRQDKGKCKDVDGVGGSPKFCYPRPDFKENREIIWRVCAKDADGPLSDICSSWKKDRT